MFCAYVGAHTIASIMHEMNNIKIVNFNIHNRQPLYANLSHFNPVHIFTPIRNRFVEKNNDWLQHCSLSERCLTSATFTEI
jgi:hypothetical protein